MTVVSDNNDSDFHLHCSPPQTHKEALEKPFYILDVPIKAKELWELEAEKSKMLEKLHESKDHFPLADLQAILPLGVLPE